MSPQGVEIVPESLTPLRRGGRTATWAIRRWETDCRTLALSGRKLALLTIIRGDKANESSERGWWHDTIKSLWHQGSLPSELSEGQTVIGIFAEVLSCSYLIKLSLCSCFRCFFFFSTLPLTLLQKAQELYLMYRSGFPPKSLQGSDMTLGGGQEGGWDAGHIFNQTPRLVTQDGNH